MYENGLLLDATQLPSPSTPSTTGNHAAEYYQLIGDISNTNRLPSSFVQLLRNLFQHQCTEPVELLTAIVYYLFFEMGFAPHTFSSAIKSALPTHWGYSFVAQIPEHSVDLAAKQIYQQYEQHKSQPQQYHQQQQPQPSTSKVDTTTIQRPEQIYRFDVNLLNLSDHELQLIVRKLFDGMTVCITFCFDQGLETKSIILSVNEYISLKDCDTIDLILQNPKQFFPNLENLSGKIKENLCAPIRNLLMDRNSYPCAALSSLPKESLWSIFKYYRNDLITLQQLSRTCVYLRYMVTEFLDESNIRLRTRRPTRIVHDNDNRLNRHRRFRLQIAYPRPGEMFYSRRFLH